MPPDHAIGTGGTIAATFGDPGVVAGTCVVSDRNAESFTTTGIRLAAIQTVCALLPCIGARRFAAAPVGADKAAAAIGFYGTGRVNLWATRGEQNKREGDQ